MGSGTEVDFVFFVFFCFSEEGDGGGGRWEMGRYGDGEMGDYGCDC